MTIAASIGASTNNGDDTELTLPLELILIIFDIAAVLSQETALSISLVCSWARATVEKHIFSTLVLGRRAPSVNNMPEKIPSLARNLWIEDVGVSWRNAIPYFSAMPDLERITLSGTYLWALLEALKQQEISAGAGELHEQADPAASSSSPKYRCRSLSILSENQALIWNMFHDCEAGRMFLSGITHMRFHRLRMSAFIRFDRCPSLTHIAFPWTELNHFDLSFLDEICLSQNVQKVVLTLAKHPPLRSPPHGMEDLTLTVLGRHVRFTGSFPVHKIFVAFVERKARPDELRDEVNGRWSIWDSAIPFERMLDGTFFSGTGSR
ncbi:hypothetical protein OE88DRAFT_1660175 [Heliocybe sulcata]|uniref:F-box domain-containing protein n=1 Tax=Heliocybe sulcata TaxID=5364 RepID=A0A5C3N3H7_9AGAM|nr:hypothetical protein OE88DRAFT_1660175 [Heliocybe sulcata]